LAAGTVLPKSGKVFISVSRRSKGHVADLARRLERMGFELLATKGTALRLQEEGVLVQALMKVQEGRPNVLDYMIDGNLHLVINTPSGKGARTDEGRIRAAAVFHGIPCITTLEGAIAAVGAMEALLRQEMTVQAVQDRFPAYCRESASQQ
jgi:carbamoyl-phosphate synthase large subunit